MVRKNRFIPHYSEDELAALQLDGIRWTIAHALAGGPQYRAKLGDIRPEDIRTLDDVQKLPFTTTDDLREGYPLPLLSVPERDVARVHASSGTTGKRKILAYTRKDIDTFALQMARCFELAGLTPEDRLQVAVGYGLWTAGAGFQLGSELFGAMTIPVGPGNLDIHLQLLQDLGTTCIGCTASMALLMGEEVERHGLLDNIRLKRAIFGAEASSAKMRTTIMEKLGLEHCFDIGGMTEMYGPGTAMDCEAHEGLHYWADLFYMEIIDPETQKPVAPGEVGEMVVTSLRKEAAPLIRYRTRDLSRFIPGVCSCGRTMPRHDRLLGRSDDMIIFRGVNIYPGQISDVIQQYPELGGEYHIELTRTGGLDFMKLSLERKQGFSSDNDADLAARFARHLHKALLARMDVNIVDPGALPRSFGKSRRVTDLRLD